MLSVLPVRAVAVVDRRLARRSMTFAPAVGALLGLAAATVLVVARWTGGTALLSAVLAVGTLAWLTRGLHLDGLADLADGLGSGKPAERALAIMKRSDIGPFGVVTLVFTLLLQVAALTALTESSPLSAGACLVTACTTGRLAITWACGQGVPAARPEGLGTLVARAVPLSRALLATLFSVGVSFGVSVGVVVMTRPGLPPVEPLKPLVAMAAGLVAATLLRRRAVRRLGGITGDVLGALCECATTAALLCCAMLLP
ncbi:adenosylcobinamide-GDP ribazoletransferase [Sphaerimonospora thailandensis]|uniref:Adenosylcobinamide-GDP ribazoletransferase n=1 Tax=Sphaerimonospora thailandensis TaxID=795644 RepID=A0A8J3RBR0_9ACTN|nr:adenosylcobinamide-GDP ribazoletransferase [Sphaerimonospora thailandensis]GIH70932.1 adenosylcobinamide-GDP ribazoletransferase [Sphaerimonospora thailandensis]